MKSEFPSPYLSRERLDEVEVEVGKAYLGLVCVLVGHPMVIILLSDLRTYRTYPSLSIVLYAYAWRELFMRTQASSENSVVRPILSDNHITRTQRTRSN